MRLQGLCVGLSLLALLAAGCTVRAEGARAPSTAVAAPSNEASPPAEGPTDLPPTPTSTPPSLDRVEAAVSQNESGPVTDQATTDYVWAIINNADRLWSKWFAAMKQLEPTRNYREPYVSVVAVQPGTPYTNERCKVEVAPGVYQTTFDSAFRNAMYCYAPNGHGDDRGVVVVPVQALQKLWSGDIYGRPVAAGAAIGDYAAGVVLAHEFGHHIADELSVQLGVKAIPNGDKNNELLADCFAGVHAHALSLGTDGRLDPGDIDEALAALEALGDKNPTSTDPHGNPAERQNAFKIGLYGSEANKVPGYPHNCLKAFWPEGNW